MLDEMDGKQARRTKNSSPLGLIFDHGCDAFTLGFQTIILCRIMQVGNNQLTNWAMVSTYAGFHFATLEEYYLGTLRLPPLNAVSDGSVVMIILYIVTGCIGNNCWATNTSINSSWLHWAGMPTTFNLGQFCVFILSIGATFTYIVK